MRGLPMENKKVKPYVGALSVRCHCPVCNSCLVEKDVLFIVGSEITRQTARKQQIKCVYCKGLLIQKKNGANTKL